MSSLASARGETIEVTEHGTPVARLVPIERPERPAILTRLEAEGRLRPAKNPGYLPQRLLKRLGVLLGR
jgi:antitoxin (DNA-binding transcriptional repressor) of toxin-antitoxin stability system